MIAGSSEYHDALASLERKLGRSLHQHERDVFRKACKSERPARSSKTRERNSKAFRGQGKTITGKRVYVSQLPLDWQCR
jgi:hypothetical protein